MKKVKLEQCPFGRGNHMLDANQLSGDEKTWIAKAHLIGGMKYKELAKRFSLSENAISRWVQAVRKGGISGRRGGRPLLINPKYHKSLVGFLEDKPLNERLDDWEIEVQKAVAATAADAGIASCYVKPISKRTMKRIKVLLNVNQGNCECTTTARMEAIADVRNALSFATMNACCVPISTPELIINVDATQFTCGDVKGSGAQAAYVGKRPRNLKVQPKKGESGLTSYFIKYYATISAAGGRARPIYIIADDQMKEQAIDVHEVTGIGAGTHPGETAYIVFCKSRVPQLEFYKWYVRIILVPWVQELREIYGIDTAVPAFFQLDGEAAQIAPFLTDTQIRELCDEHNILVGKPSGSTTSTTQALDKGPLFLTSKGYLAVTTDLDVADHWLIRNGRLRAVWDLHKKHMEQDGGKSGLSDAHRKSGIHGILRIHQSTQRAFHSKAITDSFKETGLYPFDMTVIFSNCTGNITPDEQMHFLEILPRLKRLFMEQGELLELDYDKFQVRAGTADRGQHLIVSRRRCVLLSSPGFWARELEKQRLKEQTVSLKETEKERKRKVTASNKAKKEEKAEAKRLRTAPPPPPAPVPPPPPPPPVPTGRRQGVTPARFREG
jgi:transposase